MSYANDGKCHNAEPGTYNHECGKPALWIGANVRTGHTSGFCDKCKRNGTEARSYDTWRKVCPAVEHDDTNAECICSRSLRIS